MKRIDVRNVYCVYDKIASEVASPLFVCVNDDVAYRSYLGLIDDNPQYKHSEDFKLLRLASVDLVAALVSGFDYNTVVAEGTQRVAGSEI